MWVSKVASQSVYNRFKSVIFSSLFFKRYSQCTPRLLERGVKIETHLKTTPEVSLDLVAACLLCYYLQQTAFKAV